MNPFNLFMEYKDKKYSSANTELSVHRHIYYKSCDSPSVTFVDNQNGIPDLNHSLQLLRLRHAEPNRVGGR